MKKDSITSGYYEVEEYCTAYPGPTAAQEVPFNSYCITTHVARFTQTIHEMGG
jgi:hypothetical protein